MRFQCLSLLIWLEEWYETVYKRHPGFRKGSKPLLALDNLFPMDLPDTLYGEKWAFVQLPFSEKSFAFCVTMDFDLLGIEIDDNMPIPGLAVASSRARPLAGWYFNSRWQHRRSHLCNIATIVWSATISVSMVEFFV
uniref:RNA-binding protein Tab2/Atab2 C-terminal domain-containing protein n=1 Tax=Helianthus annuus TaxID=4232 RepID=A0A251T073_HELAN